MQFGNKYKGEGRGAGILSDPSTALGDRPSAALRDHPSAALRDHPSAPLGDHPSAALGDRGLCITVWPRLRSAERPWWPSGGSTALTNRRGHYNSQNAPVPERSRGEGRLLLFERTRCTCAFCCYIGNPSPALPKGKGELFDEVQHGSTNFQITQINLHEKVSPFPLGRAGDGSNTLKIKKAPTYFTLSPFHP